MPDTHRQELLRRAVELIGLRELAIRMKVPHTTVEEWMNGNPPMPDRKLVLLAEILSEITRPG
jgi:hypothetical protein